MTEIADIKTYIDLPNGFRLQSRELADLIREFTPGGEAPEDLAFAIQDGRAYLIVKDDEAFELRRDTPSELLELHDGDGYDWDRHLPDQEETPTMTKEERAQITERERIDNERNPASKEMTPLERLVSASQKLPAVAPTKDEDSTLAFARYAIEIAVNASNEAADRRDERAGVAAAEGYVYDWSLLNELVKAECGVQIWLDVLGYGSIGTEPDELIITKAAITEIARRAATDLMSNRHMGRSTDPMTNAIGQLMAEVKARFVESFGKDLTVAEVTRF